MFIVINFPKGADKGQSAKNTIKSIYKQISHTVAHLYSSLSEIQIDKIMSNIFSENDRTANLNGKGFRI